MAELSLKQRLDARKRKLGIAHYIVTLHGTELQRFPYFSDALGYAWQLAGLMTINDLLAAHYDVRSIRTDGRAVSEINQGGALND